MSRYGDNLSKSFIVVTEEKILIRKGYAVTRMILVYITCESKEQAEDIGRTLLKKRLVGCINIIPGMHSQYFWPSGKNHIEESDETILLCKTTEKHYKEIEKEVLKIHTYSNPAIFALPIVHISKKYAAWLLGELR